jgi:nucleoside-diphosphate-sugar epimerase
MIWKNKKVIVTGGAGVIGKSLIEKLVNKGSSIRCFDIVPRPNLLPQEVEYYEKDLCKLDIKEFGEFKPDIIFHLAAVFERSTESPEFWENNFKNNVISSHKVVDASKNCEQLKKFIFASSYLIYSPSLYLLREPPIKQINLKEGDLIGARNICGASKYYTEKELEFLSEADKNFKFISARIFRVYGKGSRDVISRWIRAGLKGETIEVFGKENLFDYIFADDVAEGLIKLAENDAEGIVNLGTGTSRRVDEVVKIIQEQIPEVKIKEINGEEFKKFEASSADTSRLMQLTGWRPKVMLEEGIKKIIEYEKEGMR